MNSSRFTFEPWPHRVIARIGGCVVADSSAAMVLRETRLPPVIYFPRESVRMDLAMPTGHITYCPFKGNAEHYGFCVPGAAMPCTNIAWRYDGLLPGAELLGEYVAFYGARVDEWIDNGVSVPPADRGDYGGYPNPLMGWALKHAPQSSNASELTEQLAICLASAGLPLARLQVMLRTLHPLVVGMGYRWVRGLKGVATQAAGYEVLNQTSFTNSPIRLIFDGEGGVRRRLDGETPELDFGITKDLHEQGMTDYVAMPLVFSDGQRHALTMCTDRPGGFTDDELGNLYEVLGVLGAVYEVHSIRHKAVSLLDTYLGPQAASNVLNGSVQRGSGEDIKAVVVFSDLRESTALSGAMPRADFLGMLNQFFDCIAGAMLAHDGEVLRFIGDAVLSIFPVRYSDGCTPDEARAIAVGKAVVASHDAITRLDSLNEKRRAKERKPLRCGIGLHLGEVTYGNIGTPERLEFTVVGEAANTAARIEDLCRDSGESLLASSTVACFLPGQCRSIGHRTLRGVKGEVEVFALDPGAPVEVAA